MDFNSVKYEIKNRLLGKSSVGYGESTPATFSYLWKSTITSTMAQGKHPNKLHEIERLVAYINQNKLWKGNIKLSSFMTEKAEQKVYIKDNQKIFKLNDHSYYLSRVDYFNNLRVNHYFFIDCAYYLSGSYQYENIIFSTVVEQNHLPTTEQTDRKQVKYFLTENEFTNTRNYEYYNSSFGIKLENLHEENVLTVNRILYFKDTVFS